MESLELNALIEWLMNKCGDQNQQILDGFVILLFELMIGSFSWCIQSHQHFESSHHISPLDREVGTKDSCGN